MESFDLPEEYACGLASAQLMGENVRLVFYTRRGQERVAKFAMIIPVEGAIHGMAKLTSELTGNKSCDALGPCMSMRMRHLN